MKIVNFAAICVAGLLFNGCASPNIRYIPKMASEDAKGVTMVDKAPKSCKSLGDIEGSDSGMEGNVGMLLVVLNDIRDGAFNDLKNKAVYAVGRNKYVSLRIIEEQALCYEGRTLVACPPKTFAAHVYRVKAQVFDCGEK